MVSGSDAAAAVGAKVKSVGAGANRAVRLTATAVVAPCVTP